MHRDLVDGGHEIERHRPARLMCENGLIARKKRRCRRTTDSEHAWPVAPTLLTFFKTIKSELIWSFSGELIHWINS